MELYEIVVISWNGEDLHELGNINSKGTFMNYVLIYLNIVHVLSNTFPNYTFTPIRIRFLSTESCCYEEDLNVSIFFLV